MIKKVITALFVLVMGISVGVSVRSDALAASKYRTTMPKSLQGNWYTRDGTGGTSDHHGKRVNITARGLFISHGIFKNKKWVAQTEKSYSLAKPHHLKLAKKQIKNKTFTLNTKRNRHGEWVLHTNTSGYGECLLTYKRVRAHNGVREVKNGKVVLAKRYMLREVRTTLSGLKTESVVFQVKNPIRHLQKGYFD